MLFEPSQVDNIFSEMKHIIWQVIGLINNEMTRNAVNEIFMYRLIIVRVVFELFLFSTYSFESSIRYIKISKKIIH